MALNINRIKKVMESQNIGNKELSKKAGVPLRTVNNILGGITSNPTIDNLMAIAHALGCSVDDFLDVEENSSQVHTIAAHHDGDWTQEELDEIEEFKRYVLSKRKGNK